MSVKVRNGISKYIGWLVVFFGFYLIFVLVKGIWDMRGLYGRLTEARVGFEKEVEKKEILLRQIEEATSPAHIEKVARNELGMQLSGETLVILSDEDGDIYNGNKNTERLEVRRERNWEKWWSLVR